LIRDPNQSKPAYSSARSPTCRQILLSIPARLEWLPLQLSCQI
jgi:hypothetical protein